MSKTYKPLLEKYLSKTRYYSYKGIHLEVPPQVFHPGYFHSTQLLLQSIRSKSFKQKRFLEPGAGSGLISIYAALQGAIVTATDINPIAISTLHKNKIRNGAKLDILLSNLFDAIPVQAFDIIAINPPYYKKDPVSHTDYAWYCGANGEYFENLFSKLSAYIHAESSIHMVLCDGCDIEMIQKISSHHGFKMNCIISRQTIIETNFIYKIEKRERA